MYKFTDLFWKGILPHVVTLKKITETEYDSDYGLTEQTVDEYEINVLIATVTVEDLRHLESEIIKVGFLRIVVRDSYTIEDEEISVEPNDRIVWKEEEYEVVERLVFELGYSDLKIIYAKRAE